MTPFTLKRDNSQESVRASRQSGQRREPQAPRHRRQQQKLFYKNPDKSIIQYKIHNAFLKKCVYILLVLIVALVGISIVYKKYIL